MDHRLGNTALEQNHEKKSISSYVIGYRNSSKLEQSEILLCRNNNRDVIKAYLTANSIARKKGLFSISN